MRQEWIVSKYVGLSKFIISKTLKQLDFNCIRKTQTNHSRPTKKDVLKRKKDMPNDIMRSQMHIWILGRMVSFTTGSKILTRKHLIVGHTNYFSTKKSTLAMFLFKFAFKRKLLITQLGRRRASAFAATAPVMVNCDLDPWTWPKRRDQDESFCQISRSKAILF